MTAQDDVTPREFERSFAHDGHLLVEGDRGGAVASAQPDGGAAGWAAGSGACVAVCVVVGGAGGGRHARLGRSRAAELSARGLPSPRSAQKAQAILAQQTGKAEKAEVYERQVAQLSGQLSMEKANLELMTAGARVPHPRARARARRTPALWTGASTCGCVNTARRARPHAEHGVCVRAGLIVGVCARFRTPSLPPMLRSRAPPSTTPAPPLARSRPLWQNSGASSKR